MQYETNPVIHKVIKCNYEILDNSVKKTRQIQTFYVINSSHHEERIKIELNISDFFLSQSNVIKLIVKPMLLSCIQYFLFSDMLRIKSSYFCQPPIRTIYFI